MTMLCVLLSSLNLYRNLNASTYILGIGISHFSFLVNLLFARPHNTKSVAASFGLQQLCSTILMIPTVFSLTWKMLPHRITLIVISGDTI